MAKSKSIIKFTGTIDGLNFYYLNGELVVRKAGGGFNKKAIKNSPRMEQVRLNNSEFALAAEANKNIRHALRPLKGNHKLTFLHSRLQGLLLRARKWDTEKPKGERRAIVGLCTPNGRQLLNDFAVNPDLPLQYVLNVPMHFDEGNQQLEIENLSAKTMAYPDAATHVNLRAMLLQVQPEEGHYERFASEIITLQREEEPESLLLGIPHEANPEATTFVFLGLRFLQEKSGKLYNLNSKKALAIGMV